MTFKTTAAPTSDLHPSSVASQVFTQTKDGRLSDLSNGNQTAKRRATFINYDTFFGSEGHIERQAKKDIPNYLGLLVNTKPMIQVQKLPFSNSGYDHNSQPSPIYALVQNFSPKQMKRTSVPDKKDNRILNELNRDQYCIDQLDPKLI